MNDNIINITTDPYQAAANWLNSPVNISDFRPGQPGRIITPQDVMNMCGQLKNADQQILTAVSVAFGLIVLASVWHGVVRGNGGLRQKILDKWGDLYLTIGTHEISIVMHTVQFLDGIILPGAGFACGLALAHLLMWTA